MALDPADEAVEDEDTATGSPAPSDDWPDDDDPLPDGWQDVDLSPTPQRAGIDWAALEVSGARVLPAGLRLAGHTESVRVVLLGPSLLRARLSTGAPRSRLHGTLAEDDETGGVRLRVGTREVGLHPRREGGDLVVDAQVHLGPLKLPVCFVLDPTPADPAVVLGTDDLAGHVVVDPARTDHLGEPA